MTLEAQVATLRAALEKVHLHGNYCIGRDVDKHDAIIDAALVATAEPAKPECDHQFPPDVYGAACLRCGGRYPFEPSPAPRDAEREAICRHGTECIRILDSMGAEARRAELLAFGEKVREACAVSLENDELALERFPRDLAALLPVRK